MNTLELFVVHSMCFGLFHLGLTCPDGGFQDSQPQFGQGCMYRCHCMNDAHCNSDTGNCPGECASGWMGPGCQYGDIAYQKAARQTFTTTGNHGPDQAVDGNVSTCSQTLQLNNSWWAVNLGAMYRISGLIINSGDKATTCGETQVYIYSLKISSFNDVNVLDTTGNNGKSIASAGPEYALVKTGNALKGFEVRVENVSSDTPSVYPKSCFKHNINDELGEAYPVVCAEEQVGQYLIIQVPGRSTHINLCDVRVYGGRSLAYRRAATQKSDHTAASLAVDGATSTQFRDGTCSHTQNEVSAWWRVDLEHVYTITRMEIFNRQDCCAVRLTGFSISFAVNESYTLVYKYPETTPSAKTEVTNISSNTARLVEIALPDKKDTALTLCEVFIYGECPDNYCGWSCESPCFCAGPLDKKDKIDGVCPGGCAENWNGSKCNSCRPGRFGANCNEQCGACAMDGSCNRTTGMCVHGCLPGWTNDNCSIQCPLGWFGQNCSQECGHCANHLSCYHVNGTCTDGCSPGYNGSLCNTECPSEYFGQHCVQQCGHCAEDSTCHHVNGTCMKGCAPGYRETMCTMECPSKYFGLNCTQPCGHCVNNTTCHNVNGTCFGGCAPGYTGTMCNTVCPLGWFGQNCSQACGHCVSDSSCHRFNGTCTDGCSPGYSGSLCNTECPSKYFGLNCVQQCGNCADDSTCQNVNGTCMKGCAPGYTGTMCNTVCPLRWFGPNCSQTCGSCVNDSSCHHVNGSCTDGCSPGYNGSLCNTVLENQRKDNDSEVTMVSIGGAVGGSISALILILIATGLVLWKRRRIPSAKQPQNHPGEMKKIESDNTSSTYENTSIFNQDMMIDVQKPGSNLNYEEPENRINKAYKTSDKVKENKTKLRLAGVSVQVHSSTRETRPETFADISSKESEIETNDEHGVYYNLNEKRILTENLEEYIKKGVYLSTNIEQEYESLVSGPQYDINIALKPSNRPKNRYKGIYAYDKTRVVLDHLPDEPDSDYINACFVDGYRRERAYIASQGPTTTIVNDFWRMIWQYDINKIVMLTGLSEQGKHKCHQYWPTEGLMEFGNSIVEIVDEEIFTEYTIRFLKVSQTELTQQKPVTQLHFTAWPDRDVPESPAVLVQFWNKVRNTGTLTTNSPILVHCSAGIGRTGTFIALDYLYDEGQATGSIDVFNCVNSLRRQRVGMVQNAEQYVYLHEVLVEAFLKSGKRVDVDDFAKYYQQMREIQPMKHQSNLQVEFESFRKDEKSTSKTNNEPIYEKEYEYACARLTENRMKNRYSNIIPSRRYRPFLSSYVPGSNDYINAVTLPTLKNKNGLLLTQTPLPETVVDFWTLAFENRVQTLVMLNEESIPGEKIGIYWPKKDHISQFGPFSVKRMSVTRRGTYVERMFHVSREGWESVLKVKQFACSVWKIGSVIPESCGQFLSFLEEVDSWQRQSENQPMIVHCLNGAGCSGLFCVLWCVLERVKADREVPIRSVVSQMRVRRQQIIPDFEQYQFCHDVILEYLTNFATYTNL